MVLELLVMWWCIEAQHCKDTGDISNIFSTIIGTVVGFVIGGLISWLIYNRQEKMANKQEHILERIQTFEEKHDEMLNTILILDKKIDELLENKNYEIS
jgi:LPXTG-motif cell wall-anchored protein